MKKGQAALEFLMTYGWAILVVIVAIGALAYFGVLSPDRFLPSKCTLPSGVACTDFTVTSAGGGGITVVLRNGLGFDATAVTVYAEDCDPSAATTLNNGQLSGSLTLDCSTIGLTGGQKYDGGINVTYTNSDSGLAHTLQGQLTARIE